MLSQVTRDTERVASYQQLYRDLVDKFGKPEADFALRDQLELLSRCFPKPTQVAGLRILDLGCGCDRGAAEIDGNAGTWAPWLCRATQMLGGFPVGIDIGFKAAQDTFEFHRINLLEDDALSRFERGSFDAVSCSNLFSSPHLVYRLKQTRDQRAELLNSLKIEAQRLLKPSGILIDFDERLDNH